MNRNNLHRTLRQLRALIAEGRRKDAVRLISELLERGRRQEAVQLLEALLPADQSEVFFELPPEEQERLLGEVELSDAADILEELDDEDAAALAESLDPEALSRLLDAMEPDEAADLLGDVSPELRGQALKRMDHADAVRLLLRYPDDSAGGLMTSDYYAYPADATASEVLRSIRGQPRRDHEIPYVYALDDEGRLAGVLRLADLIRAHPQHELAAIMQPETIQVRAEEDREVAARLVSRYDLMAIPVVDAAERLLGVITADDAMETLEEEATEDLYEQGAIVAFGDRESARSQVMVRGPLWRVWRVRIPFLIITMIGGMLAGGVIGVFEESLEAVTMLAFFIPVVMDMGGNAGTQSSTIFTRALVLGHIDMGRYIKHLLREMAVGSSMGLVLGVLAGLVAGFWQGAEIGLVVGLALFFTITLAATLGFLVPYILVKIGLDQAAGADPFITTIKDITGLLIYFALAHQFMSHLI